MVLSRLCPLQVEIDGRPIWRQQHKQHGVLLEC